MRILLASNGNWCGTGYGTQSKGLSRALRDLGHTVGLAPTYGLYGGRLVYDDMMVYPPAPGDMLGVESLPEHALDFKADLVITLYDIWPFATDFGHTLNAPWCMPPETPIPLADGRVLPIKTIVDERLAVDVLGYHADGTMAPTPIRAVHAIPSVYTGEIIEIVTESGEVLEVTAENEIAVYSPSGPYWISAGSLSLDDMVYCTCTNPGREERHAATQKARESFSGDDRRLSPKPYAQRMGLYSGDYRRRGQHYDIASLEAGSLCAVLQSGRGEYERDINSVSQRQAGNENREQGQKETIRAGRLQNSAQDVLHNRAMGLQVLQLAAPSLAISNSQEATGAVASTLLRQQALGRIQPSLQPGRNRDVATDSGLKPTKLRSIQHKGRPYETVYDLTTGVGNFIAAGVLIHNCAWFPVDSIPVAPRLTQVAASARYPVVYSKFGLEQMRSVGLDCHYVPHAVDTTVFKPGDKRAAREIIKIPQDKFIVLMVAMNKGIPARKAFPEQIAAFAEFHKSHPDSGIYLHTNFTGPEALPIEPILWDAGLNDGCIYTTPPYKIKTGLPEADLALLYQACDVLMNASYGEGFGLTILEAQAAGTPVITNNVTSMPEITFYGQTVEPAQRQWNPLGCWWYPPKIEAVTQALEDIYEWRTIGVRSWDNAESAIKRIERNYSWSSVRDYYWKPLLEEIEIDLKAHPKPTEVFKMCRIRGIDLMMADWPGSQTIQCVESELVADQYGIETVPFKPGDTVVDIGANVGVVSCYLGKRWPDLRIIAVEPEPRNYQHLVENLARNKITNVTALNVGITGDGRDITLATPDFNSGGATIYNSKPNGDFISTAKSMTLAALFEQYEIEKCKFLKCDCEGAEYEVLGGSPVLDRIEYFGAEFHVNGMTDAAGYSPQALVDELSLHIPHLKFQAIRIP